MSGRRRATRDGWGWKVPAVAALVLILAAVVAGIVASETGGPSPVTGSRAAGDTPTPVLARSVPTRVQVPAIGADSSLIGLGADPVDRSMVVPDERTPEQASWYTGAKTPGELGPAVILGHINGGGRPGVFARLAELRPGAEVRVAREDGATAVFVVERVEQHRKTDFPVYEVFGPTAGAELRLISCGGELDRRARSYTSNIIAFARLARTE